MMSDEHLKNQVQGKYVCSTKKIKLVEDILNKKGELSNNDRQILDLYLDSKQSSNSIASMKRDIFNAIGYDQSTSSSSVVSRSDLEAIYKFIMTIMNGSESK